MSCLEHFIPYAIRFGCNPLALRLICRESLAGVECCITHIVLPHIHSKNTLLVEPCLVARVKLLWGSVSQSANLMMPAEIPNSRVVLWVLHEPDMSEAQKKLIFYELMQFGAFTEAIEGGRASRLGALNSVEEFVRKFFRHVKFRRLAALIEIPKEKQVWQLIESVAGKHVAPLPTLLDDAPQDAFLGIYPDALNTIVVLICRALMFASQEWRVCAALRLAGNKCFQDQKLARAIQFYSAALWFGPHEDTVLCNRALANLKRGCPVHALLDATDAHLEAASKQRINAKAINHMMDAADASGMQPDLDLTGLMDSLQHGQAGTAPVKAKWSTMKARLLALPEHDWDQVDSALERDPDLAAEINELIHVERSYAETIANQFGGMPPIEAIALSSLGVEFWPAMIQQNEDAAKVDAAVWPTVFLWAAALALAKPAEGKKLATLVGLRWAEPAARVERPWNTYLMSTSRGALETISEYMRDAHDIQTVGGVTSFQPRVPGIQHAVVTHGVVA